MIDLAFFETAERTEYSDKNYAVLGRALTVATHFENNCKALANTMSIRENSRLMEDPEKFQSMLRKWSKRQLKGCIDEFASTIKAGLQNQGLSNDIIKAFEETIFKFPEEARESRNFIAHELAMGMSDLAESDKFRKEIVPMIKEHIRKIAKADFYISSFIEIHVNKMNISPSLDEYINRISGWVCKIE
jgi:uncharacterized membrane protein YheB (UPF0754 family)